MDIQGLKECLTLMDYMQEERLQAADIISRHPESIEVLLELIADKEKEYGFKGGWVLDLVLQKDSYLILPYLDRFTAMLGKLRNESAIRPMAKICELLCIGYYRKKDHAIVSSLKEHHRKAITEACFDWLIGSHKVAAKAYSMTALYELGKEFGWVHAELKMILDRHYDSGSAGYKARARKVLNDLGRP